MWIRSPEKGEDDMFSNSRRKFLQQAAIAGVASSSNFGSRLAWAQAASPDSATARIYIDSRRTIAPLDRNLFGSFL